MLKNYKKEFAKLQELKNVEFENSNEKRIKNVLQENNVKYALFLDTIGGICEILNKYTNKKMGEKTKEKIQNEIQEYFDNEIFCYISVNTYYSSDTIHITTRDITKKYNGSTKIVINTKTRNDNIVNNNNEIQKVDSDMFVEEVARSYTKNIEKTTQTILQKHEKAKQLENQLNEISNEIHQLTNYVIDCVKYTSSVKFWI